MSKSRGTNSILLLYLKTAFRLRWSWFNFLAPIFLSFFISILFKNSTLLYDDRINFLESFLKTCLSFNGAVLGFIIAAFAIFASTGDRNLIIFSTTNKREGDHYSFHKTKLLTFFKSFFWLYSSCILSFLYLIALNFNNKVSICGYVFSLSSFLIPNLVFFYAQCKVFVELKILIFTIYNSSLTQARFMAQDNQVVPTDSSND